MNVDTTGATALAVGSGLAGLLVALIYNTVASVMGGIKVDLD
jgi:hypothetical protein